MKEKHGTTPTPYSVSEDHVRKLDCHPHVLVRGALLLPAGVVLEKVEWKVKTFLEKAELWRQ